MIPLKEFAWVKETKNILNIVFFHFRLLNQYLSNIILSPSFISDEIYIQLSNKCPPPPQKKIPLAEGL